MKAALLLPLAMLCAVPLTGLGQPNPAQERKEAMSFLAKADGLAEANPEETFKPNPFSRKWTEYINFALSRMSVRERMSDPFLLPVRGSIRFTPPALSEATGGNKSANLTVKERPEGTEQQPVPTFEQAIRNLPVRAVNVHSQEFLIGSRTTRVGDMLVLDNSGFQFSAWVQAVGEGAIVFRSHPDGSIATKGLRTSPGKLRTKETGYQESVDEFLQRQYPSSQ